MLKNQILSLLSQLGQKHLSLGIDTLGEAELSAFLHQLQHFPANVLEKQRHVLIEPLSPPHLEPLCDYHTAGNESDRAFGAQKKIGCLILAGGQGSRLCSALPKALTPVSLIKKKTLLQLFCEKAAAASRQLGYPVKIAVMTSPFNHDALQSYLEAHHRFGLHPDQIELFPQEMLPFLSDQGNWMLEHPGKIACGPDGNGHSLKSFVEQGIWEKWKAAGIEHVNILPIDNPLADPFDTELVGFHAHQENDVTLKAIFRHDPQEKMGIICLKNKKIGVQEYSELPSDTTRFELANTSLYCLNIDFIKTISAKVLPWHLARKTATILASTAQGSTAETTKIWKCETFIFDILDYAQNVSVLVYPREQTYAPIKNNTGENSLATLQAALLTLDQNTIFHLTGKQPPDHPFELAQEFHYPTTALLKAWQGKSLPLQDYIEANL